ncbi:hypothetical protein [Desulfatibacillum aliphaticivorans]|uniref:hypothetical protein n=1 Tax=Desulfatibacillum aliphaticivorans TaxID=218208 RepID=UPI000424C0E1|nr:hypothetical protein [Desulfatibacillum aliphaticivorans]
MGRLDVSGKILDLSYPPGYQGIAPAKKLIGLNIAEVFPHFHEVESCLRAVDAVIRYKRALVHTHAVAFGSRRGLRQARILPLSDTEVVFFQSHWNNSRDWTV